MASGPSPPSSVSSSPPPASRSAAAPPSRSSAPSPPVRPSLPSPPARRSAPAPPSSSSSPAPPASVSPEALGLAEQPVVAAAAVQRVAPSLPVQLLIGRAAEQRVGALRADQPLDVCGDVVAPERHAVVGAAADAGAHTLEPEVIGHDIVARPAAELVAVGREVARPTARVEH